MGLFNKKTSLKFIILLLVGYTELTISSCHRDAPGVYKNNQINAGKHEFFKQLNTKLYTALKADQPREVENMMSRELLDAPGYRRVMEMITLLSQNGPYTMLDEYYILKNNLTASDGPINTVALDGTKYNFFYPNIQPENYVALMLPKTKGDKFLITAVFTNYDYGWRLSKLSIEPYTMNGKNAAQLSLDAADKFNRGYLVDAYLIMRQANDCITPSDLWAYPQHKGINQFYKKVCNVISSYTYPLIIDGVPTKPKIFEVSYQRNTEGLFPVIRYVSSIDIRDTTAIKKENNEIKKRIGKMFLGIDKDKKYIYFSAYNRLPKPKITALSFDMTDKL